MSSIALLIKNTLEDNLRNCEEVCPRIDSKASIEDTTNKVFVDVHKFLLSDLKKISSFFWFEVEFLYFKIW